MMMVMMMIANLIIILIMMTIVVAMVMPLFTLLFVLIMMDVMAWPLIPFSPLHTVPNDHEMCSQFYSESYNIQENEDVANVPSSECLFHLKFQLVA